MAERSSATTAVLQLFADVAEERRHLTGQISAFAVASPLSPAAAEAAKRLEALDCLLAAIGHTPPVRRLRSVLRHGADPERARMERGCNAVEGVARCLELGVANAPMGDTAAMLLSLSSMQGPGALERIRVELVQQVAARAPRLRRGAGVRQACQAIEEILGTPSAKTLGTWRKKLGRIDSKRSARARRSRL